MGSRTSQTVTEVLYTPDATARASQKVVETLYTPDTVMIRVSHRVVEVLYRQQTAFQGPRVVWID